MIIKLRTWGGGKYIQVNDAGSILVDSINDATDFTSVSLAMQALMWGIIPQQEMVDMDLTGSVEVIETEGVDNVK
jgi:hypothetical protein